MRWKARRPIIRLAVVAVGVLALAAAWLVLDARVDRLSRALDRDLLEHSRETFPRPPLPGPVVEGAAIEFYERAFALAPPLPTDWTDFLKHARATGNLPAEALLLLDAAQDALVLVERGARTRATGCWDDPDEKPKKSADKVLELCRLASLDAIRLSGEREHRAAVDRCLAAVRLSEDQRRYWLPFIAFYGAQQPLRTLINMADRLPPEEIDRAADFLALEAAIPNFLPTSRLSSLYLQCSFRRALTGVDDDLFHWGHVQARDASGGYSWYASTSGIKGYLERKTCMARVRSRVPAAWELLREETASRLARGSSSTAFERTCNRSENPVIAEIGFQEQIDRERREYARLRLEATILALLARRFENTEGRLPGSLEEIRPATVRPSPHGSRWRLLSHPRSGRPGIWLVPYLEDRPIQGL